MDNRINGVKIISANENISEGSKGIILEYILEGMAEYYSADLSEKVIQWININASLTVIRLHSDSILNLLPSSNIRVPRFLCPNTAFYGGIRAKCLRSLQNFFYIIQSVLGRKS